MLIPEGNDIKLVSDSAALIQQAPTVKNTDIRKFLDSLYQAEVSGTTRQLCKTAAVSPVLRSISLKCLERLFFKLTGDMPIDTFLMEMEILLQIT
eukprot:bmy_22080T0